MLESPSQTYLPAFTCLICSRNWLLRSHPVTRRPMYSSQPGGGSHYSNGGEVRLGSGGRSGSPTSNWRDIEGAASTTGSNSEPNTLAGILRLGAKEGGARSVCVLDTNALLDALSLLSHLSDLLLQLAHDSVLYSTTPPPLTIVIPHHVLEELDGLKLRNSSSVSGKARAAARWVLRSVQANHRSRTDEMEFSSVVLPVHRRPVLVQTSSQARDVQGVTHNSSVDEIITLVCSQLEKDTGLPTLFCSNDVIARARAEAQGVRTFDLEAILELGRRRQGEVSLRSSTKSIHDPTRSLDSRDVQKTENRAMREVASILLEQWADQVGIESTSYSVPVAASESAMQLDIDEMQDDARATTPTHDLNPHIDWQTLSSPPRHETLSSPPRHQMPHQQRQQQQQRRRSSTSNGSAPATRYLSYYERKQLELQQKQRELGEQMVLDDDEDDRRSDARLASRTGSGGVGHAPSQDRKPAGSMGSVWAR